MRSRIDEAVKRNERIQGYIKWMHNELFRLLEFLCSAIKLSTAFYGVNCFIVADWNTNM